jgi:hypothetical protein
MENKRTGNYRLDARAADGDIILVLQVETLDSTQKRVCKDANIHDAVKLGELSIKREITRTLWEQLPSRELSD